MTCADGAETHLLNNSKVWPANSLIPKIYSIVTTHVDNLYTPTNGIYSHNHASSYFQDIEGKQSKMRVNFILNILFIYYNNQNERHWWRMHDTKSLKKNKKVK